MRLAAVALLTLTLVGLLSLSLAAAQSQPKLTATFPEDGAVLAEPPSRIRFCYSSPVNIQNLNEGGDFSFGVVTPENHPLGLRIVFQISGLGVDIFPGIPDEAEDGEWKVEWRVTDPETMEAATGTLQFTVAPDGIPVPNEPPISCKGGEPEGDSPPASAENGGDEGWDTLLAVLVAAGTVGAAVVLGTVLVLLRRRTG